MPRVTVEWLSTRSKEQRQMLAERITASVADVTGCELQQVTIVFNEVDPEHQSKGGVFWSEILKSKEQPT